MSWEWAPEEESLQATPENRHRRCRRDVLGQTVPCIRAAATGKARSPTVDSRVRRTFNVNDDEEQRGLRVPKSAVCSSSSARYDGAVPCKHLHTRTASLNSIRIQEMLRLLAVCGACLGYTDSNGPTHQCDIVINEPNSAESAVDNEHTNNATDDSDMTYRPSLSSGAFNSTQYNTIQVYQQRSTSVIHSERSMSISLPQLLYLLKNHTAVVFVKVK